MFAEFEPEENIMGIDIENSYLRRLLQVLRLPSTDLKPKKPPEEDALSRLAKCGERCYRFLRANNYD